MAKSIPLVCGSQSLNITVDFSDELRADRELKLRQQIPVFPASQLATVAGHNPYKDALSMVQQIVYQDAGGLYSSDCEILKMHGIEIQSDEEQLAEINSKLIENNPKLASDFSAIFSVHQNPGLILQGGAPQAKGVVGWQGAASPWAGRLCGYAGTCIPAGRFLLGYGWHDIS